MIVKQAELVIDVHCQYGGQSPRYRIYVDNDLITERSFTWESVKQYVEEHIIVNVHPGQHTIRIENVDPDLGIITAKNLRLDGVLASSENTFEIV